MTLIAVVGGFTTFGFIQSRFKKSEQEIIEVRNTIFQLFSIINENVLEASAYHFRRMGLEYENQSNIEMSFISYISAAKSLSDFQIYINTLTTIPNMSRQQLTAKSNVVNEIQKDLIKSYELIAKLNTPLEESTYLKVIVSLNSMSNINSDHLRNLCAGIRHNLNILQQRAEES